MIYYGNRKPNLNKNNYYLLPCLISCLTVFIGGLYVQSQYISDRQTMKQDYTGATTEITILTTTGDGGIKPDLLNTGRKENTNGNTRTEHNTNTDKDVGRNLTGLQFTGRVYVKGFPEDSLATKIATYGYKLGGMSFITMLKCENGGFGLETRGDSGKAVGICQMNELYHKLPKEYYTNRQTQVELCYQKYKSGTPFYGPSRILANGKRCSDAMKSEFIIKN